MGMARAARDARLETRTSRLKLETGKRYFLPITGGLSLMYRRTASGFGTWSARVVGTDGREAYRKLGSADDFQDGGEIRIALAGERLVKAFAGQPGIAGNLSHTLGTGNIAKCLGDEGSISICLFEASLQVSGHLLRSSEMFGNVVASGSSLGHSACSERFRARRKAVLMSVV